MFLPMLRLLLAPDSPPPGSPGETTPPAAPPPAAKIVAEGEKPEDSAGELVRLRQEKKEREVRISELEDENHRLKQVPKNEPKSPAKKESWLRGFFPASED